MLDPNPRVCLRPRRAACPRQLSILSISDGSQPGQGEAWAHLSRARVGDGVGVRGDNAGVCVRVFVVVSKNQLEIRNHCQSAGAGNQS